MGSIIEERVAEEAAERYWAEVMTPTGIATAIVQRMFPWTMPSDTVRIDRIISELSTLLLKLPGLADLTQIGIDLGDMPTEDVYVADEINRELNP